MCFAVQIALKVERGVEVPMCLEMGKVGDEMPHDEMPAEAPRGLSTKAQWSYLLMAAGLK
jgi:hypothetical protein